MNTIANLLNGILESPPAQFFILLTFTALIGFYVLLTFLSWRERKEELDVKSIRNEERKNIIKEYISLRISQEHEISHQKLHIEAISFAYNLFGGIGGTEENWLGQSGLRFTGEEVTRQITERDNSH